MRLLIVEDEKKLCDTVAKSLYGAGYEVDTCYDGDEALDYIFAEKYDLIVLDLNLPGTDGMDVLRELRQRDEETKVLVLSARSQIADKVEGLDLGANDYLTKPFSSTELLARIRVALRHMYKQGGGKTQTLFQVGELQLDAEKRRVFLRGAEIHVTPMEYSLLTLLFKNQGKVLTTAVIIREIWGPGYGNDTQALRALMAGLRRKLEKNPAKPRYILTEIGVGYRLTDE